MQALHRIRRNPLTVLTVVVAALIVWVSVELLSSPKDTAQGQARGRVRQLPPPDANVPIAPELLPVVATDTDAKSSVAIPNLGQGPRVLVSGLTKLRPGMTRIEVEQLLGTPAADQLLPLSVEDGRLTYRTAYELIDPDAPQTVRPIPRRLPRIPDRSVRPSVVALEFDATRPGHPLVDVLYPDPLF